ncbi:MAG TPA: apolipoprotein N-acyltransferase [Candidatus Omnitrophota bacterium]|nr:apolipoprotein N-acyltransferase [Candidatus Omnitrophota bacterium]
MKKLFLPILSGLLAALCFPKFGFFPLAWIALVPLFIDLKEREGPKDAAGAGLAFGLVFFGVNLFWINTLNHFAPGFAALGYIVLIAGEALFVAVLCYVLKFLSRSFPPLNPLTYPVAWTFFEWLRTAGPFGITAGELGYSQAPFLPLVQIASFSRVFGVSFLIVMMNAALADSFVVFQKKPAGRQLLVLSMSCLLLLSAGLWGVEQLTAPVKSDHTLKIAVIQGNIPQDEKLDARFNNEIFSIHETLTRGVTQEHPDLIIWPESVVLSYLVDNRDLFPRVRQLARDSRAYLLIGTPFYTDTSNIYNSLICVSPTGEITGRYDKQRIVPFGEYLPFRPLLLPILQLTGFFRQDFDFGPAKAELLEAKGLKIGGMICFESTFADLAAERKKQGARMLLTITNDAWFGNSSAPYDHFDCGVFRAVENREWFVQCANTGISGVIDPYGRVVARTGVSQRRALTFEVPLP